MERTPSTSTPTTGDPTAPPAKHRAARTPLLLLAILIAVGGLSALGFAGADARWVDAAAPGMGQRTRSGPCGRIAAGAVRLDVALADLVAAGTLDQNAADAVRDRLRHEVREGRGRVVRCAGRIARSRVVADVSDLLGLRPRELVARYREGRSLTEIAADQNVGRDELVATVRTAVVARIDGAVAAGRLTEEERAAVEDIALARVDRLVDRHRGDRADGSATPATSRQ